jgi:hypothetical protein
MNLFNKIILYKLFKFLPEEVNSEKDEDEERFMNDFIVKLRSYNFYFFKSLLKIIESSVNNL